MTTQVQVRGAVTATQAARTLASREFDIDTTLGRVNIHNGSTAGGIPHLRAQDHQNNTFVSGTAGGTANALTLSVTPALASYATHQAFRVKIASNNTGAATMNVDSLGAKTIKKPSGGALVDLSADDLVADAIAVLSYNGTYLILDGGGGGSRLVATLTAASSANLSFDDLFQTNKNYRIELEHVQPATDGVKLGIRLAAVGGSYLTASGDYEYSVQVLTGSTRHDEGNATTTYINLVGGSNVGNAASESVTGTVWFNNPRGSTRSAMLHWVIGFEDSANSIGSSTGCGQWRNTTGGFATASIDSIRFLFSSGNIASGVISVFEEDAV